MQWNLTSFRLVSEFIKFHVQPPLVVPEAVASVSSTAIRSKSNHILFNRSCAKSRSSTSFFQCWSAPPNVVGLWSPSTSIVHQTQWWRLSFATFPTCWPGLETTSRAIESWSEVVLTELTRVASKETDKQRFTRIDSLTETHEYSYLSATLRSCTYMDSNIVIWASSTIAWYQIQITKHTKVDKQNGKMTSPRGRGSRGRPTQMPSTKTKRWRHTKAVDHR